MHIVEMVNDILQSIYVYMPQEILIILLAGLTLIVYESIKNGKKELIIKVDKKYYRPLEIDYLRGDPRKAFKRLNYKLKHTLKDLVRDMLDSDIKLFKKQI